MPQRIIVHDALNAMARGHLLRKVGSMSNGLPERGPDSIRFVTLSETGRAAWHRSRLWYQALPWYLKICGRLGLPLPR